MEAFPHEVRTKLGWYVYRLIDPRTGFTFYVGKGRGDRVFHHAKGLLDEEDDGDDAEVPRADPGYLYPACLKQFAQSLGLTVLMALPMLFQRASTLRSADVRRTDLIFAKRFSIGLRSGL